MISIKDFKVGDSVVVEVVGNATRHLSDDIESRIKSASVHPDKVKRDSKLGKMPYEDWQECKIVLTKQEQKDWIKAGQPDLAKWYNSDEQRAVRAKRRKMEKDKREQAKKEVENNEQ